MHATDIIAQSASKSTIPKRSREAGSGRMIAALSHRNEY